MIQPQIIQFGEDLTYEEKPKTIVDRKLKKLHSKEIAMVKVVWENHTHKEATWELEKDIHVKYPQLFQD